MRSVLDTVILLTFLVPASAQRAGTEHATAEWTPRSTFERGADFAADPVPQIRRHLAAVIESLEARDVSDLGPALRERRAQHVARLAEYAAAGRFPRNVERGVPTPIFIDGTGSACAVGHLMIESGARDLAERVAATQNTAYVPDIVVPGVADWIGESGLTADECALIQPSYTPSPCQGPAAQTTKLVQHVVCDGEPNSTGYPATLLVTETEGCAFIYYYVHYFTVDISGLPPNKYGLLLYSRDPGFVQQPFGSQGNLCLGGAIGRLNAVQATPAGTASSSYNVGGFPFSEGGWWYFQFWYRDYGSSNLSQAIKVRLKG